MAKRSSNSVEQQLDRLKYLGNHQLKQLLVDLESKKRQLPVEDHAIIDWGIDAIKAKILTTQRLMKERDIELREFCEVIYEDFIEEIYQTSLGEYSLKTLRFSSNWRRVLDEICYQYLTAMARAAFSGYQLGVLYEAVDVFKVHLFKYLFILCNQNNQQANEVYQEHISALVEDLSSGQSDPRDAEICYSLINLLSS